MMGIRITLDKAALAALEAAAVKAAVLTMEALKSDVISAQVMPFDTGDMQNTQTFVDSNDTADTYIGRLVTGSPQARRLYYHPEYNYQTVNNPNAGGEWLEPWIVGERKDFVRDTYSKIYKKEAGL